MASKESVVKVKGDLAALKSDFKNAKIETNVSDLKYVDGKIMARFNVSGLPTKKDQYSDSYRNWTKIFDDWKSFSEYSQKFFENEEFMLSEAKSN